MKAAVLHEPGPLLPVEEVDLEAPKHGEVLADMVGAGVCHSDYHMLSGKLNLPMPLVMGHEGAGIVSETGPGVTGFSPGDKVIFSMDKMCGQCRNCTLGSPTLCLTYGRIFTMGDGTTRFSGKGRGLLPHGRHLLRAERRAGRPACPGARTTPRWRRHPSSGAPSSPASARW